MKVGDKRYVFADRWREGLAIDECTVIAVSPSGRPAFNMRSRGWGAKRKSVPDYTDKDGFPTFDEAKAAEVERVERVIAELQERLDQKLEFLQQIKDIPAPAAVAV